MFAQLPAGTYTVKALLEGFNSVERKDVDVRLGARLRMDIVLNAGVTEKIEVIGQAPVVDLSTTTTGATFTSDMMNRIPIGRSFSSTLALAPAWCRAVSREPAPRIHRSAAPAVSKTST
jgi:hypothetical protein